MPQDRSVGKCKGVQGRLDSLVHVTHLWPRGVDVDPEDVLRLRAKRTHICCYATRLVGGEEVTDLYPCDSFTLLTRRQIKIAKHTHV